ncbi:MAG: hypothetical protein E6I58_08445 [Chloroflexi bacterium]|nr:MAG: hypothetical protein E6J05_11470 [Chloroflexota bacterium]TME56287.1 MAG: hypothetical protein E6I58_08445 [Chloroflexota bacterium]
MSTDITSTVEEVAFGAARTAREVAADPIGSARKQVKDLERKGTPSARKANRRLSARINAATAPAKEAVMGFAETASNVASELLPERIAIKGLQLVKFQARRQDPVGDVAKRALRIFNGSFKTVARVASRLERASELPARSSATASKSRTTRRRSTRRTSSRRSAAA